MYGLALVKDGVCYAPYQRGGQSEIDFPKTLPVMWPGPQHELARAAEAYSRVWEYGPAPKYPCPCCGFYTLDNEPPGAYQICLVCWWEDDNVQFHDPDYRGGANRESLNEARAAFRQRHRESRGRSQGPYDISAENGRGSVTGAGGSLTTAWSQRQGTTHLRRRCPSGPSLARGTPHGLAAQRVAVHGPWSVPAVQPKAVHRASGL